MSGDSECERKYEVECERQCEVECERGSASGRWVAGAVPAHNPAHTLGSRSHSR